MRLELKTKVRKWEVLNKSQFDFHRFEEKCDSLYASLVAHRIITLRPYQPRAPPITSGRGKGSQPASGTRPHLSNEDFSWRLNTFLDSQGRCRFCKDFCGSEVGQCTRPRNRTKTVIPDDWIAPPRSASHQPPCARSSPHHTQNLPPRARTFGRPPYPATTGPLARTAAITECPELDTASLAALRELDEERDRAEAERCAPGSFPPKRIVLEFL